MFDNILSDIAKSMKNKESDKTLILRTLVSSIKNVGIEKGTNVYDNDLVISTIQKMIKQRKDSIEQFYRGNRFDLVEKEKNEITILSVYLPKQMSEDEYKKIVDDTIVFVNATTKKDIGKVMQILNTKLKGLVDMKEIGSYLNTKLS